MSPTLNAFYVRTVAESPEIADEGLLSVPAFDDCLTPEAALTAETALYALLLSTLDADEPPAPPGKS